jgi:chorismate mutase/prephenate dehydratase
MTAAKPDSSLEDIRRDIDAIDQQLLDLVLRRFEATGRVQAAKKSDGSISASPLRPAREAQMLRKLVNAAHGPVTPQFLVRLWRVILSASTQAQAPVVIHAASQIAADVGTRIMLAEHFCGMGVESHAHLSSVFSTLKQRSGDLGVAAADSPWAEHFLDAASAGISLTAALPVFETGDPPRILVFGHAEPQPSGDDETIVLCKSQFIRSEEMRPLWQTKSGPWTIASFKGFLSSEAVSSAYPGAVIAGRYPSPIEVTT